MFTFLGRAITLLIIILGLIIFFFFKIILLLTIAIIGIVAIKYFINSYLKECANKELIAKNQIISEEIDQNPLLDILDLKGFIPNATELVFLNQNAEVFVPSIPENNVAGNFGSIAVPLPFHLIANLGKFGIKQKKNFKFTSEGFGKIYLTDNRIVFISEFDNIIIKFNKIINMENLNNGVRIDIEGSKPIKFITGDVRLYATYMKIDEENKKYEALKH